MSGYIAKRLLLAIPTLVGLSLFIFIMTHVMPGDVTSVILGEDATPESRAAVRLRLGLDRPLYVQYGEWVWDMATLDVKSLVSGRPLTFFLQVSLPLTLNLAVLAVLLTVIVGVPLGTIAAMKQNQMPDYVTRIVTILGLCMPSFWVAILILYLLVAGFDWVPERRYVGFFESPWENMRQMIWPALVLAFHQVGFVARMTRSTVLEVLREDYTRTAHAKGLRQRTVTWRHVLPNALIPVVTLTGVQVASLANGALVVEKVFNLPGVGFMVYDAIQARDYPFLTALTFMAGGLVVFVNLAVDVLYGYLDPRIRVA